MTKGDSSDQKHTVYFRDGIFEEIYAEAKRLDRSVSWVIQRAWKLSREQIKEIPSP